MAWERERERERETKRWLRVEMMVRRWVCFSECLIHIPTANYNVTHSYLTFGVRASQRMRVLSLQKLWSVLGFIAGPGSPLSLSLSLSLFYLISFDFSLQSSVVSLLVSFGKWNDDAQAATGLFNDWTMPGTHPTLMEVTHTQSMRGKKFSSC